MGLHRGAGPRADGRLHAAQLLAQHPRHPVRPLAQRAAGRLRPALRPGRHPGAVLRHLQRLRALREPARLGRPTRSTSTPRSTRSRHRDFDRPGTLAPLITTRQRHPPAPPGASPACDRVQFHPSDNPAIVAYSKTSDDGRRRRAGGGQPRPLSAAGDARCTSTSTALGLAVGPCPTRCCRRAVRASATGGAGRTPTSGSSPGARVAHVLAISQRGSQSMSLAASSPSPRWYQTRGLLRDPGPGVLRRQRRRHG